MSIRKKRAKLTIAEKRRIEGEYRKGTTLAAICTAYNVSIFTIYAINEEVASIDGVEYKHRMRGTRVPEHIRITKKAYSVLEKLSRDSNTPISLLASKIIEEYKAPGQSNAKPG